jgi:hypothetical protein
VPIESLQGGWKDAAPERNGEQMLSTGPLDQEIPRLPDAARLGAQHHHRNLRMTGEQPSEAAAPPPCAGGEHHDLERVETARGDACEEPNGLVFALVGDHPKPAHARLGISVGRSLGGDVTVSASAQATADPCEPSGARAGHRSTRRPGRVSRHENVREVESCPSGRRLCVLRVKGVGRGVTCRQRGVTRQPGGELGQARSATAHARTGRRRGVSSTGALAHRAGCLPRRRCDRREPR